MTKEKLVTTLGAILFVSLAINLFMAGLVVGNSVRFPHGEISDTERQDRVLRESLSDVDKLVLKQAMDVNRAKIISLHDELDKLKQDIRDIVRKEPLDEKAISVALDTQKNKELALVRLVHASRKSAMEKMSPEGQSILSKLNRLGFDPKNGQCH